MGVGKAQAHKLAQRTYDVRRFVPVGEILHDANIDDAIDAAETAARAAVGPGLRGPGPVVYVPAGVWRPTAAHQFERFDDYRCAVGLIGEGRNETVFLLGNTGGGQPLFTFGSASATAVVPFAMNMHVGHFSICAETEDDCDWSGMRFYGCVNALVERVYVRGLTKPTATYAQGIACEVLPALENGVEVNSQFMVIRDCDFSVNMTGLYARLTYPLTIENTHCQQNHFEDAIFEACLGSWKNSGAQFQGDAVLFPTRWHGQRKMPSIVTGFSRTTGLASGTGATCGTTSGNRCLVTLPGATLNRTQDRGRWIELTPAGSSANELKVRGMYKIDEVESDDSAWIRKGSDHTSQGSLSWQIREAQAGSDMVFEGLYDEGLNRAMFGFWRDSGGNGCYTVRHPLAVGQDYIVEADGPNKVIVDDPLYSNVADKIAHLRMVNQSRVEAAFSDIIVDDYSYPGLVCLSDALLMSGRNVNGWRDSNGVPDVRLRSICERLGAVEILDLRVAGSVSLSGADVLEVTGLVNGSQCLPSYAGREAQWDAADVLFDSPCIANVEGAVNTTGAGMRMTIDSSVLPDRPYTCTIVLIGRLESATPLAAEARRVEVRTTDLQQKLALADGTWVNDNLVLTEGPATGNVLTVLTPAVDTDVHCWIWGRHPNHLNVISSDDGEDYRGNNAAFVEWAGHTPGEDLELRLADGTDATFVRPFRWAFVAIFTHALSHAETRQIMSAARAEFPLTP